MRKIEQQYPIAFDKSMNEMMTFSPNVKLTKPQRSLQKIFLTPIDKKNNYNLYEKLYSTIEKVRKEAINHLCLNYETLKDRQKLLIKNVLLGRLQEDNYEVVQETLYASKKFLSKVLEKQEIEKICFNFLIKAQVFKQGWWKISKTAIALLGETSNCSDIKTFFMFLPFLFPMNESELKSAKKILSTPFGQNNPILKPKVETYQNFSNPLEFSNQTIEILKSNGIKEDVNTLINTLHFIIYETDNILYKYTSLLLLNSTIRENCDIDTSNAFLKVLEHFSNTCKFNVIKKESVSIIDFIAETRNDKFPVQAFLQCLDELILKIATKHFDFVKENLEDTFYYSVMKLLVKGTANKKEKLANCYRKSLDTFIEKFAFELVDKISMYLNFCANFKEIELQLQCLNSISNLFKENPYKLTSICNCNQIVIPYILVNLCNENKMIRLTTLNLLQFISENIENEIEKSYAFLVNQILLFKEEILLDCSQVPQAISNILTGSNNKIKLILNSLLDLSQNKEIPIALVAGINKILSQVKTIEVLNTTVKYACNILLPFKIEVDSSKVSENLENKNDENNKKKIEDEDNIKMRVEIPRIFVNEIKSNIIFNNIEKIDATLGKDIRNGTDVWEFIKLCFKLEDIYLDFGENKLSVTTLMLNQINRELFECLTQEMQKLLLNLVIETATFTHNPEHTSLVNLFFKKINLDSEIIKESLIKMRDVESPKLKMGKKRRRVNIIPTVDVLDTEEWKKGVTILEFLQDKKKVFNTDILLPILFEILKKCLDFDEQGTVEYVKQLVLNSILNCCGKMVDKMPEDIFNMELVVQCIRASQNPQTHHHALLVLAYCAKIIPQQVHFFQTKSKIHKTINLFHFQVLHHIMAIFTFVGSSVLRHDDAYSFQIITKIIDTIIPILVEDNTESNIILVLRVFVDAILDVPEHRRIPLFKQLLLKIGVKENLHVFLLLMFEAHVKYSALEKQPTRNKNSTIGDAAPKRLDVAIVLSREFHPQIVIANCVKLITYIRKLPVDKSNAMEVDGISFFDIQQHSPKQFRHYKYTIILFTSNLLSSKEFVNQIAALKDEDIFKLEEQFKNLIIEVLSYIQDVSKMAEKNKNTPQAQYWKVMLHHSYDILDSLNAVLTAPMFLLVVKGLMDHNLITVRRRTLELFNSKLQHDSSFFSECNSLELLAMITPTLAILKGLESKELNPDEEIVIQTALLTLKLLVKILAYENPEKFIQILNYITGLIRFKLNKNVLASLILCLAELCSTLKVHSLPCLSEYMPSILKIFKSARKQENSDLLILSLLTAVQKILDDLALFLSPYLEKLLIELSILAGKYEESSSLMNKLIVIREKIGTSIPIRVLIPAIEASYGTLLSKKEFKCVAPLFAVLEGSLSNLDISEIQGNLPDLTTLFLNALQFRVDGVATYKEANEVEAHIIKALSTLILKLSESTFRPLYYKLYDWAIRTGAKSERIITFYSLSSGIAESLKGLFVLFAGHFLNNAASLLDFCNVVKSENLYFEDETKNILLLENVLKTLQSVFQYDTHKFINKDRFEVLMQPLVDQIENTLGGEEALVERSKKLLIPCIVQFTVATGDDSLWKQMNYQILLKLRHSSSCIRLVALAVLTEVTKRLGEDFLPLLPETIPFLAELLEDEDENVEKTCKKAVQEMEKVLGESLQKYF